MTDVWFNHTQSTCYIGKANDGLEWMRHSYEFDAPKTHYVIKVTGWIGMKAYAIVDDFGNLVQTWRQ